ncbi:hypothetical protein D0X99_16365 [Algoriphagus lacus]|uniref:Uncharacterized protein n=1 Tax=Algoriphagus lacus TaxID=2056311 RepID=A0A418PNC9_9BACT|nr:hypothetical protein [Algoriphagus lacus]RIW13349.1 hypothetical protein D0X99_16365 [Algoriphagus lacus]
MIRVNRNFAGAMEFTSFKKKEGVSDDELFQGVNKLESVLAKQSGVIFHCLVRNLANSYANVLFVDDPARLEVLTKELFDYPEAQEFLALIDMGSVQMKLHRILKKDFVVPEGFACVEHGTFRLKEGFGIDELINVSNAIEEHYLNKFENHLGHFVGQLDKDLVSEISIGKTYAKTKQECYGYYDIESGQALMSMADLESMNLDFWYLMA